MKITWGFVRNENSGAYSRSTKSETGGESPVVCVFTIQPGDSDACQSTRKPHLHYQLFFFSKNLKNFLFLNKNFIYLRYIACFDIHM